jgi:uncharacterized protein
MNQKSKNTESATKEQPSNDSKSLLLSLLGEVEGRKSTGNKAAKQPKTIRIRVLQNDMVVFLSLTLSKTCRPFTEKEILKSLEGQHIVFGIDEQKIRRMLGKINSDFQTLNDEIVARGKQPTLGKDGNVTYHFDTHPSTQLKVDAKGRVNHKELDIINNVHEGDLLAEKSLPIAHVPGMDVYSKPVVPPPVKGSSFVPGRNVYVSEDGLKCFAAKDGQVFLQRKMIQVSPVYTVAGNLGLDTGNINFNGMVVIQGDIPSGFKVKAHKDIQVDGAVEGAELTAGGNISIRGGMAGQEKGSIRCRGNFEARFVERAEITCHGDMRVETSIVNSKITCFSKLNLKQGNLLGGRIIAVGGLECREVGSKMGVHTEITIGDKPVIRERLRDMNQRIQERKKTLEKLRAIQAMNPDQLDELLRSMPEKAREDFLALSERQTEIEEEVIGFQETREKLEVLLQVQTHGKLAVQGKVYPNTTIVIGHAVLKVRTAISHSSFVEDPFDKRVRIHSL